MVGAFINAVLGQSGEALTTARANQLIAAANQTKATVGCPRGVSEPGMARRKAAKARNSLVIEKPCLGGVFHS
jgi:hypothetical protein